MPASNGSGCALRLSSVYKTFGETTVLQDFSLELAPGEVHALLGQNGSGKSTVVKLLSGYHKPDGGERSEVDGKPFLLGSGEAARAAGLRFVHQNLGLIESLSVSDNFNIEAAGAALSPIKGRDERDRASKALHSIGYGSISPSALVGDLVAAERTIVALARALDRSEGVPVLVLDEPTASLPARDVEVLLSIVEGIARRGTGVLLISHHLDEVLQVAHRATVLRDGKVVAVEDVSQVSHDVLVERMLGRELAEPQAPHRPASSQRSATPRLRLSNLQGATVADVTLEVEAGAVLGVAGLTGSGREELADLITGRLPRAGEVAVDGRLVPPKDPRAARRAGVYAVPADRAQHGLVGDASVRENLVLGSTRAFWRRGFLRRRDEREHTQDWVRRLDVRPADPEKSVALLSGGNQQKVVIGRSLRLDPGVLVLDEPTQGVDVGSKADLHVWVDAIAAQGAAVVVCSTDTEELARLCTEVIVMRRGRAAVHLSGSDLTTERIDQEQLATSALVDNEAASALEATHAVDR